MGFEEIDESYRKEIDNADKEFIEAIKTKKDIKEAERIYIRKLKNAREKYGKLVGKNLGLLKGKKKKVKQYKIENTRAFKVNLDRYNLTGFEKFKYRFGLFKFKLRISLRNFRRSLTPQIVFYYFVVFKIKLIRFFKRLFGKIGGAFDSIKNSIVKGYEGCKEAMKKFYEKLSNLPGAVMTRISNLRKKGEKKEDKKEVTKE